MMLLVLVGRYVLVDVPTVGHEIHRLAASAVLVAMFVPVLLVTSGNTKIHGLDHDADRRRLDDNRLRIDHLRRRVTADVDTAVETRLPDTNRYAVGGGKPRNGDRND